jgi:hypothetical protein
MPPPTRSLANRHFNILPKQREEMYKTLNGKARLLTSQKL